MKPSKRNKTNAVLKAEKRSVGRPKLSKYAMKVQRPTKEANESDKANS